MFLAPIAKEDSIQDRCGKSNFHGILTRQAKSFNDKKNSSDFIALFIPALHHKLAKWINNIGPQRNPCETHILLCLSPTENYHYLRKSNTFPLKKSIEKMVKHGLGRTQIIP